MTSRAVRKIFRAWLRAMMYCYISTIRLAGWLGPKRRTEKKVPYEILVTGTFYSDNWLITHLRPLAMSSSCTRVLMVASTPVPEMDKVRPVYAPPWLSKTIGNVPARLLIFVWIALRYRPQVIGGFHLLLNGLLTVLLARVTGAYSLYFCGGGPREVLGGGYNTENRLFNKLDEPDKIIEDYLLKSVSEFDLVIIMGTDAKKYFQERGIKSRCEVLPGGFDEKQFLPSKVKPHADVILVGRLSEVKRVDLFLEMVKQLNESDSSVSAIIVGDGPLKASLEIMSQKLGLSENVKFAGWQDKVEDWLQQSRIFVLTSDSEGVSQAMIQAMLCGLVPVVANVGDLKDLVEHEKNGFLVSERTPDAFSARVKELLFDQEKLKKFSHNACETANSYQLVNVKKRWDKILVEL